jgi:hypothetical protein
MAEARRSPRLTYQFHLKGGRNRLRELILYVSDKCEDAPRFGKVKLNKIIWRADFKAFADRGIPVTGRPYQKLPHGPAPVEMAPLLGELEKEGRIEILRVEAGGGHVEERVIVKYLPDLSFFSKQDLSYVNSAIDWYWNDTAREVSDDSHGIGWRSRDVGDPMPYELEYLSDRTLSIDLQRKLSGLGKERGWKSA